MKYGYELICAMLLLCCLSVDGYVINPRSVSFIQFLMQRYIASFFETLRKLFPLVQSDFLLKLRNLLIIFAKNFLWDYFKILKS